MRRSSLRSNITTLLTLGLARVVSARVAVCTTDLYPVTFADATVWSVPVPMPPNQLALSGTLTSSFSVTAKITPFNQTTHSATYNISATLCTPPDFDNGVVNMAVHGVGFGKEYWDFPYQLDTYSFAEAAAKRGHATFFYDRLGVGESSRPVDGINQVQSPVNVEIAHQIASILRQGVQNYTFQRIVGVGHSYGSMQLVALSGKYPDDLDDIVLTGFSASSASMGAATIAFSITLASVQNPTRWANYSNAYLATGGPVADQTAFFSYPYFDAGAFEQAQVLKQTLGLGELLTLGRMSLSPTNFTGGVFVITGSSDFVFCGGNCTQIYPGSNVTFVQAAHALYPVAANFTSQIVPITGHVLNIHKSAPTTYGQILDFVSSRVL